MFRTFTQLTLFLLSASTVLAQESITPRSFSVAVNGKTNTSEIIQTGSPFVTLDLNYAVADDEQLSNVRLYASHSCSIASESLDISWCNRLGCRIGAQADFDSSFESKQDYYHVFDANPRDVNFSVELNVKDSFGAIVSSCQDISLRLSPCDAVLEVQTRTATDDKKVIMEFVDAATQQPLNDVEVLVSSGPVALLTRPEPGVVVMHTVPKKNEFKFSFSRSSNHRFVAGPFAGQMTENGLKKIKVALCAQQ